MGNQRTRFFFGQILEDLFYSDFIVLLVSSVHSNHVTHWIHSMFELHAFEFTWFSITKKVHRFQSLQVEKEELIISRNRLDWSEPNGFFFYALVCHVFQFLDAKTQFCQGYDANEGITEQLHMFHFPHNERTHFEWYEFVHESALHTMSGHVVTSEQIAQISEYCEQWGQKHGFGCQRKIMFGACVMSMQCKRTEQNLADRFVLSIYLWELNFSFYTGFESEGTFFKLVSEKISINTTIQLHLDRYVEIQTKKHWCYYS